MKINIQNNIMEYLTHRRTLSSEKWGKFMEELLHWPMKWSILKQFNNEAYIYQSVVMNTYTDITLLVLSLFVKGVFLYFDSYTCSKHHCEAVFFVKAPEDHMAGKIRCMQGVAFQLGVIWWEHWRPFIQSVKVCSCHLVVHLNVVYEGVLLDRQDAFDRNSVPDNAFEETVSAGISFCLIKCQ